MSALKKYLIGFGFAMIGLFGGFVTMFISILVGSFFIVDDPADSTPVTVGILVAHTVSFMTYLLLVSLPMMHMAWRKGSFCKNFHALVFGALPLTLFFLRDTITPTMRFFVLWLLASLAVYHIAVIYSRYRRRKEILGQH
ncbi:MAG: hypothetical protein Q8Q10_04070 [bacterium]|nr:hypothetical protein [bacterium]